MMNELIARYPLLAACEKEIGQMRDALIACYEQGGKLMICGNGGSCADSDHIVGELMKGFLKKRPLTRQQRADMQARCPQVEEAVLDCLQQGLPAVALPSLTALNTAYCNDVEPELIFAQGVLALGKAGDTVLCISTSGNAKNVCAAAAVAKSLGLTVLGLTGQGGGRLAQIAHVCVRVPETETFKVQELHLPVYHYVCAAVESHFFQN